MPITIDIKQENVSKIIEFLKTRPAETIKELNKAIKVSVLEVERQTKINSPVKTGLMRMSITSQTNNRMIEGEVYAGVQYAIYVHEGTRHMRKRPFLLNAVKSLTQRITSNFEKALANVLKK